MTLLEIGVDLLTAQVKKWAETQCLFRFTVFSVLVHIFVNSYTITKSIVNALKKSSLMDGTK